MLSTTPQAVDARLTRSAIFLVVTLTAGAESEAAARSLCGDLAALVRGVGFRSADGGLSCIMGIGSHAWDRLFGTPKPKDLHPFREIRGVHHAVATPGDLLFHIRAARMDLCFEIGDADHGAAWRRRLGGRRGARLPLFRQPRPAWFRRRHGKPRGAGRDRRHADRRGRRHLRRRQLCDRPEIPSRP